MVRFLVSFSGIMLTKRTVKNQITLPKTVECTGRCVMLWT
jgi:hypothetical protein